MLNAYLDDSEKKMLYILLAGLVVLMLILNLVVPKHKKGAAPFVQAQQISVTDYAGHTVSFVSYRLRPLIVYSWASWSPYSADEFANLVALKKIYGNKINIIAVNRAESLAEAKSFTDKLTIGDAIILTIDPSDAYYKSIGGYAMPETVFIAASGDATLHQRGPMQLHDLESAIQGML